MQSSCHKINQKINFLKILFFFKKFSELWTNIYRAWRKSFGQGYQNWKLYSKSSEYHVADKNIKIIFWNFCKFSFYSDLEHEFFGFVATEFSPGLSKRHSRSLSESSLRCWYWKWHDLKRNFFEPWRKNFDLFLKTAFYVSKGTFWVKNFFWKISFFFKRFGTLNEHLLCLARKFSAGISKLKNSFFIS